jgi:hypothetical protein
MTCINRLTPFDPRIVDTTPGGSSVCPFSPPAQFAGGGGEYLCLMRIRYRDPSYSRVFEGHAQAMSSGMTIHFAGPYSTEAMAVLAKISEKYNLDKKAS